MAHVKTSASCSQPQVMCLAFFRTSVNPTRGDQIAAECEADE